MPLRTRKAFPLTSNSWTDDLVLVGRISRPHGTRGAVVVDTATDDPRGRFAPGSVVLLADGRELVVARFDATDRSPLVTFDGIGTRSEAESVRGESLYIAPDLRRPLEPDEFWPDELVGLDVVDLAGEPVGQVIRVETGLSQDRLIVEVSGTEIIIPLVTALVPDIDVDGGRIVTDLPAGFMD